MIIPTLTPEQRRRQPILAAALDCLRDPAPGEEFIDMRPEALRQASENKRPRRSSHSRRAKATTRRKEGSR